MTGVLKELCLRGILGRIREKLFWISLITLRIIPLLQLFQLMTGLPMLSYAELCMFQLPFLWYQIGQVWPLPGTGIPPSSESKLTNTTRIHLQHLDRSNTAKKEVVCTMTVPFREYNRCVSHEMEFNPTELASCLWASACLSTFQSATVAMVKRTEMTMEWQRRPSHPWADLLVFINILCRRLRYFRRNMWVQGPAIMWRMRTIIIIVPSNRLEAVMVGSNCPRNCQGANFCLKHFGVQTLTISNDIISKSNPFFGTLRIFLYKIVREVVKLWRNLGAAEERPCEFGCEFSSSSS